MKCVQCQALAMIDDFVKGTYTSIGFSIQLIGSTTVVVCKRVENNEQC